MKSIKKLFTLALMLIGLSAYADVKIQVNPNVLTAGEKATISVILDNSVAVKNFETSIVLPEGIQVVYEDDEIAYEQVGRIKSYKNWTSQAGMVNGKLKIVAFNTKGLTIAPGNEAIFEIQVEATADYNGEVLYTTDSDLNAADGEDLGEITEAPAELPEPVVANIVISKAGYATYYAPFTVNLSKSQTNVVAYIVTGISENNELVMEQIEDGIIPAYQPVLLEGDACIIPESGDEEPYVEPKGILEGVEEDGLATIGNYVLQSQNGVVGFYQVTEEVQPEVKANRATLVVPNDKAKVKAFFFGEATAISTVATSNNAVIFDLQGRKVSDAQKGIFVVNGKKVIK